ncbi:MAG: tautomerase family protein [Candidatus Zixiibacteriota bacterium]|jgi:4-oxalocrotonate tautomerase family enzyme
MPFIIVEGPSLAMENKRKLVKGLTEAAAAAYEGMGESSFVVLFREISQENVSVGGTLLSDMADD